MGGRLLKCGIFFSLHQILLQDNHIRAPYVSFMGFALLSCIMLSAFINIQIRREIIKARQNLSMRNFPDVIYEQ